jgi:hypothetical protein
MESPLQKARKELEGRITNREGAKSQVAEESTSPYGRMSPLQMAIGDLKKKLDSRAKGPETFDYRRPSVRLHAAVEWVESRGKVNAVSPKGAIGPMQTMPKTLKDPGYGVVPARDNSVAELRRVGQDYIDAMYKKYGMKGGLAAYNWGPGNWERALKRAGGDVDRALASAPKETREYVPAVMSRL